MCGLHADLWFEQGAQGHDDSLEGNLGIDHQPFGVVLCYSQCPAHSGQEPGPPERQECGTQGGQV